MDQLQVKTQAYRQMLQRQFPVSDVRPTYVPPSLTPLFQLNEWEETAILIVLWNEIVVFLEDSRTLGTQHNKGLWIQARLKELRTLYPYVVRSISQGVPAWLRDP